jgi:2-dehydropantoate 2-reductase
MRDLRDVRIAVIGTGAVGGYYGGLLAFAGYDVHFLLRSDHEAVRRDGLAIHTGGRTLRQAVKAAATPEEIGPVDLVIIALKATANAALDQLVPPLLGEKTALLTLQNGLGNEEFLAARWDEERVLGGLCFVCLNRTAPGVIEHFDHGTLSLGEYRRPPGERLHAIAEAFTKAGIEVQVAENLVEARWRKLVWNVPFNGLAIAAGGATVADVLADEGLRKEARALMGEVLAGAASLGHPIPASFADWQLERSASMGPYKASSLIDWELHRAVEVEAIWGEPWRQGTAVGARMDRLGLLYQLQRRLTRTDP